MEYRPFGQTGLQVAARAAADSSRRTQRASGAVRRRGRCERIKLMNAIFGPERGRLALPSGELRDVEAIFARHDIDPAPDEWIEDDGVD